MGGILSGSGLGSLGGVLLCCRRYVLHECVAQHVQFQIDTRIFSQQRIIIVASDTLAQLPHTHQPSAPPGHTQTQTANTKTEPWETS